MKIIDSRYDEYLEALSQQPSLVQRTQFSLRTIVLALLISNFPAAVIGDAIRNAPREPITAASSGYAPEDF